MGDTHERPTYQDCTFEVAPETIIWVKVHEINDDLTQRVVLPVLVIINHVENNVPAEKQGQGHLKVTHLDNNLPGKKVKVTRMENNISEEQSQGHLKS